MQTVNRNRSQSVEESNIKSTAPESRNAVIELHSIPDSKIRGLFSGNVVQGQTYNVVAGDASAVKRSLCIYDTQ